MVSTRHSVVNRPSPGSFGTDIMEDHGYVCAEVMSLGKPEAERNVPTQMAIA